MLQTQIDNLKRLYAGPMDEKDVALLRDMQAFLDFCIENGLNLQVALGTMSHDVNGLLRQELCFTPKVTGYAKIMNELRRAHKDPELLEQLASTD